MFFQINPIKRDYISLFYLFKIRISSGPHEVAPITNAFLARKSIACKPEHLLLAVSLTMPELSSQHRCASAAVTFLLQAH